MCGKSCLCASTQKDNKVTSLIRRSQLLCLKALLYPRNNRSASLGQLFQKMETAFLGSNTFYLSGGNTCEEGGDGVERYHKVGVEWEGKWPWEKDPSLDSPWTSLPKERGRKSQMEERKCHGIILVSPGSSPPSWLCGGGPSNTFCHALSSLAGPSTAFLATGLALLGEEVTGQPWPICPSQK